MNAYKCVRKKRFFNIILLFAVCIVLTFICVTSASAATYESNVSKDATENNDTGVVKLGNVELKIASNKDGTGLTSTLQILLILTLISLAPSILIMVTSFTRILIVMHFTRSAIGMQSTPPNQILIGLSLFLTIFIMSPVFAEVNTVAIQPLNKNEITTEEAFDKGLEPIRVFMYKQTRQKDLELFLDR